jgi:hypothetical protein
MYLVAIAWLYVALMMALAEAMHPAGTGLGAVVTFLLYGLAPVSLVMYLLATPLRRRRRQLHHEAAVSTPESTPEATTAAVTASAFKAPDPTQPGPGTKPQA